MEKLKRFFSSWGGALVTGISVGALIIGGVKYYPKLEEYFKQPEQQIKYPINEHEIYLTKRKKISREYKPDCNNPYMSVEAEYMGVNPNDFNSVNIEIYREYEDSKNGSPSFLNTSLKLKEPFILGVYKPSNQKIIATPLEVIVNGDEKLKVKLSAPKVE